MQRNILLLPQRRIKFADISISIPCWSCQEYVSSNIVHSNGNNDIVERRNMVPANIIPHDTYYEWHNHQPKDRHDDPEHIQHINGTFEVLRIVQHLFFR